MAENTEAENWEPLTVGKAVVVELGRLRWPLSATPDADWTIAFHNAPLEKSGSAEYVLTRSAPEVVGREIEWEVGPKNHLDANIRVRSKVEAANAAYPGVLTRRAEDRERQAAQQRAREDAIKDAQRVLDEASGK
jgi:hypothetical protein